MPAGQHMLCTRSGNPSVNVNLFKGLTHIGYGEHDHTVILNSWCSHACVISQEVYPGGGNRGEVREVTLAPSAGDTGTGHPDTDS